MRTVKVLISHSSRYQTSFRHETLPGFNAIIAEVEDDDKDVKN